MVDKFTTTETLIQAGGGEVPDLDETVEMDFEGRILRIEEYLGFRLVPPAPKKKVERKLDTPEYRKSKEYR